MIDLVFDLCGYFLVIFVKAVFYFHKYISVRNKAFATSTLESLAFCFSLWFELARPFLLNNM